MIEFEPCTLMALVVCEAKIVWGTVDRVHAGSARYMLRATPPARCQTT